MRKARALTAPPSGPAAAARTSNGSEGMRLGPWGGLLIGAWLGRAAVSLPGGLDRTFDALLPVAAAVFVFMSYRRFIRTRMAASSAARRRGVRSADAPRA